MPTKLIAISFLLPFALLACVSASEEPPGAAPAAAGPSAAVDPPPRAARLDATERARAAELGTDAPTPSAGGADAGGTSAPPPACPAPTITALTPAAAPTSGGTTIVVAGTDLSTTVAVLEVDGVVLAFYVVPGSSPFVFTAPAHAAGVASVTVTTPCGTASAALVYEAPDLCKTTAATQNACMYSDLHVAPAWSASGGCAAAPFVDDGSGGRAVRPNGLDGCTKPNGLDVWCCVR